MMRNFSLSLSLPHSLSLSLYLFISLSRSLYILLIRKKESPPQSLLQTGGDQGTIRTVNPAVCKDVAKILGASIGHAH